MFRQLQPSILTVTPEQTQSNDHGIDYPRWRASILIHISQNHFTPTIHSYPPTTLGELEIPAITPSHSGPTMPELHSVDEQHISSRRNMATGLERSIMLKARDLIWE